MLIVEDDFTFVELVRQFLEHSQRASFRLEHAASLAEARACLPQGKFDIVLLDLSLPDSTRDKTLGALLAEAPNVPVVIMSGHDDEEMAIQSLQAGAQDYLVKGQSSLPLLVRVIHHAIERKRLEISLLERETIHRLITENAKDLIAVLDRSGRRIYLSPSYRRLLGDVESLRGTDSLVNVHPDDAERMRAMFRETVETGVGQRAEYRFVCSDRSIRHIESQGSVVKDQHGRVSRVVVVSRDITERRQADESLRISEQRYRHLLGSVTDYIYTVELDEHGRVRATRHNPSCVAVTGYTPEDFEANPGLGISMVLADDRRAVEAMVAAARKGNVTKPVEHRIRHRDGSIRWVRATTVPHWDDQGRVVSYDGLISDVTERREADDRVRRSEALYHSLVASLPQCIMRKDREGRFIFVNQRFADMLQASPGDIVGKTDFDFYPREMAEKFRADDRRVMDSGELFETVEENLTANGVMHDVQVMKIPIRDEKGGVVGVQCIFWDITSSRQAQREIERREELLQGIMDNSSAVIYVKDREGRYLYINREFEKLFGITRNRAVGRSDFAIFPPDSAQRFQENDRLVLSSGKARILDEQAPHPDGLRDYLSVKFPLFDSAGRAYAVCGISTDITDRKLIEKQLHQRNQDLQSALIELRDARAQLILAEKFRAVGTLAAGVAHQVKNPLQEMSLLLDNMVQEVQPRNARMQEDIKDMRTAIDEANVIVRALLDYARPEPLKLVLGDPNAVIATSLRLTQLQLVGAKVRVKVQYDPMAPKLPIDRQKLEQVFINLVNNSIQAMKMVPESERQILISVRTCVHLEEPSAAKSLGDTTCWLPGDPLVVIELADTGPGIPETHLSQVFDPFFTTKPPGEGTGLGLYVVQSIVTLHGGNIELTNRPEGGALVRITLNPKKGRKHHGEATNTRG